MRMDVVAPKQGNIHELTNQRCREATIGSLQLPRLCIFPLP